MAGLGTARLGERAAAIDGPPRTARRKAASRRQAPQIGRAAGDRVDVAFARLAVHGRRGHPRRIGVRRRLQHARDTPSTMRPAYMTATVSAIWSMKNSLTNSICGPIAAWKGSIRMMRRVAPRAPDIKCRQQQWCAAQLENSRGVYRFFL